MGKNIKIEFDEPDAPHEPWESHQRALERVLAILAAALALAVLAGIELNLPPEYRVGYSEAIYTSP